MQGRIFAGLFLCSLFFIQSSVLVRPGEKVGDLHSIVLLTEYKNMDAFMESQKVFAAMREHTNWQTGAS